MSELKINIMKRLSRYLLLEKVTKASFECQMWLGFNTKHWHIEKLKLIELLKKSKQFLVNMKLKSIVRQKSSYCFFKTSNDSNPSASTNYSIYFRNSFYFIKISRKQKNRLIKMKRTMLTKAVEINRGFFDFLKKLIFIHTYGISKPCWNSYL